MVEVAIRMPLKEISTQPADNIFSTNSNLKIQVGRVVQCFSFCINFPEEIASAHQVVIYVLRS